MEQTFTYSLRRFLDDYFIEISRAVIIEDGIKLSEVPKPFATIEYIGMNDEIISSGRTSHNEIYRYQLGVFAKSRSELTKLESEMRRLLTAPQGIPVYDLEVGWETDKRYAIDLSEFTPMPSQDNATETFHHRGYFVAAVSIYRDHGSNEFTQ